jgi:small subunit ribosomal protein S16
MLRIRLARTGKKNHPHYAVVVTEKTNPASDGNFVEKLGSYSPIGDNPSFTVDHERAKYWVSVGAQPTETVARLLVKDGLPEMEKFYDKGKKYSKKNKKAPAEEEEAPADAPAEEAAPEAAPAEEVKEEAPAETPAPEAAPEAPAEEPKAEEAPVEESKEEAPAAEEAPAEEAAEAPEEEKVE